VRCIRVEKKGSNGSYKEVNQSRVRRKIFLLPCYGNLLRRLREVMAVATTSACVVQRHVRFATVFASEVTLDVIACEVVKSILSGSRPNQQSERILFYGLPQHLRRDDSLSVSRKNDSEP